MKENEILFVPLGGGQSVGASCYYIRLGRSNILLDCGTGMSEGQMFYPDFYTLMQHVSGMGRVSQMFVSHAHMDHAGGLLEFLKEAPHTPVYMTDLTLMLTEHQLRRTGKQSFVAERLRESVTPVSFNQSFTFGDYRVSFYPAGHIPGAMMTLLEYGGRNILYTGDYSLSPTALTSGCVLPEIEIDTLVICAVHARHSDKLGSFNGLRVLTRSVARTLNAGTSVFCRAPQLSKGVELLSALNQTLPPDVRIYIDEALFPVIRQFERVGVPVITARNRQYQENVCDASPHVVISADRTARPLGGNWCVMDANFSLHDSFDETAAFIKKINPKIAVVVHSPCDDEWNKTVEQELALNSECQTQFLFAENGQAYLL